MPKKVLACDDEPYILEVLSEVVQKEGYHIVTARDGEEALRLARAERPDLILLDIRMPKKTGFEVCRELRSDPRTRDVYIMLLTAMGQERDMEEGYQSGANDYINKPFSPRHLAQKLHELLDTMP